MQLFGSLMKRGSHKCMRKLSMVSLDLGSRHKVTSHGLCPIYSRYSGSIHSNNGWQWQAWLFPLPGN